MPGSELSMTEHNPHQDAPLARAQTAKREMVDQHGTQNQIERYYAGMLPEEELLALARNALFAPLASFRRYSKLQPGDVKHSDDCFEGPVRFFTREAADGISGDEWRDYRRIQDALEEAWRSMPRDIATKIEVVEHVGLCSMCDKEAIRRAASVRIEWAGHELVREYQLGGA